MEFLNRLKALIPAVFAAEPAANDLNAVAVQSPSANGAPEREVIAGGKGLEDDTSEKPQRKDIDFSHRPEIYSDVLTDRGGSYEYFPERTERYKAPIWKTFVMMAGREESYRFTCEQKLYDIINNEPLIKLLVGSLKTAGCDIDIRRNFSCEMCYSGVCGGYDTETQQVVMCMNTVRDKRIMTTVLAHELIHMFDHCVNETDFKSIEHLACTEIRAINLTSCSLVDSFFSGYVSFMDVVSKTYHKKHSICVKERALKSVMAATASISEEEARKVIDKVFPSCYNDLEPIGRRLRHKTTDGDRAFFDGQHYGYV